MKQSMIAMCITVIVAVCGGSLGSNKPSDKEDIITTEINSSICIETTADDNNYQTTQQVNTVETVRPTQAVTTKVPAATVQGTTTNILETTIKIPETTVKVPVTSAPQTTTKAPQVTIPQTTTKVPQTTKVPETTTKLESSQNLSYARQVVELVNQERAKAGLNPVTVDTKIEAAALIRAKEIEKSFSHTRPNGSSFSTVLTENSISFRGSGENIAWGQRSPQEVMNGWMNSSGHRANILNSKYTKIGVGYYVGTNGRTYWAQLFIY